MQKDYEKIGIKISMAGSMLLSFSAVVMALIAKSQAILLDGLYTFITLLMAFVSLKVIDMVKTPETNSKPFGYMAFEPLLNLVKNLIVLTVLAVFLISNIQELCTGGRCISIDMTGLYIFMCLFIYGIIIFLLKKCGKKVKSSILDLEIKNWFIDSLLTVGIAVSLIIAIVIMRLGYTQILPYIDPVIVIMLVILSMPSSLKLFMIDFKRLLLISPENNIENEVKTQISNLIEKYGLINMRIWGLLSGRSYYIFIYSDLKNENVTLSLLDEIRAEIFGELSKIYPKFWADIMFTRINPEDPFELSEKTRQPSE